MSDAGQLIARALRKQGVSEPDIEHVLANQDACIKRGSLGECIVALPARIEHIAISVGFET